MKKFKLLTSHYSERNAFMLAQIAQLAYRDKNEISNILDNEWGFTRFDFFDNAGTQCFLAGDENKAILAFRGTEKDELDDILADAKFFLQPGPKGRVHKGFQEALTQVWNDVMDKITGYVKDGQKLWVTGHSLGAALATLATAKLEWEQARRVTGSYILGSPRVGDKIFARAFNRDLKDRTFRFVNNNDIVARVPPRSLGYRHVGSLRYLDVNGDVHEETNWISKFIDRIEGKLEEFGNSGIDGIEDHNTARYVKILGNLEKRGNSVDFRESLDVA